MKQRNRVLFRRLLIWLTVLTMLMGTGISGAWAAPSEGGKRVDGTGTEGTLTPPDYSYESGNVILHKQAVRTGPKDWTVNVKVTVGDTPVEKRKLEVVFVLDCSGSMAWCADESHDTDHTHSTSCYRVYTCGKEEHTHSYSECTQAPRTECTRENNPDHYRNNGDHRNNPTGGTPCVNYNGTRYLVTCGKEAHTHGYGCPYTTSNTPQCGLKEFDHSTTGAEPCKTKNAAGQWVNAKSRLDVAKEAIGTIVANMTKDGSDNVIFHYVIFSSNHANYNFTNGVGKPYNQSSFVVKNGYANVIAEGGTHIYHGIQTGIEQFSNSDYKKVLVVLGDGAADDNESDAGDLEPFKKNGGTVFSVGFTYSDSRLESIASDDGAYVHAANADSLKVAFESLEQSLTAMLEDPMGTNVGFTADSLKPIQTAGGNFTPGETIYWHPSSTGGTSIKGAEIEYEYKVTLDEKTADLGVGLHADVPLNEPTYFKYGIDEGDSTEMKSAAFPIPIAEYAFSSIQTTWQTDDGAKIAVRDLNNAGAEEGIDLKSNSTEVESVISDYQSAAYTPHFEQPYGFMPMIVPIEGTNNYYRYIGTTVKANNTELGSLAEVDATQPVAYQVVHEYELVEANQLYISGTKIMNGRDFNKDDNFTFVLTPITPNAPLPENGVLTLTPPLPTDTSSVVFTFDKITFNTEGIYEYTIKELPGSLDGVIYDTVERKLVVEVTAGRPLVATPTYTVNGVEVKDITIVNSLETGSLKVEKTEVISHMDEHQDKEFDFLISARNASNRQITGTYEAVYSDGRTDPVTFNNGYATVKLKAGQSVIIHGLTGGVTYTVTEDAPGGFTATATGNAEDRIVANEQQAVAFTNTYASRGQYNIFGQKTLEGATLRNDQFSFYVRDENGDIVATTTNARDGNILFPTLEFTHEDLDENGECVRTYQVGEIIGSEDGILYDHTVHTVTLNISDNGDGTLNIVSNLETNEKLPFTNQYITGLLTVSKTVTGNMGNRYAEFPFTLTVPGMASQTINVSTDGGATFKDVRLDAGGETTFELMHGQNIIFYPVAGEYTVTETDNGDYTTSYSLDGGEAQQGTSCKATLSDNGDTVKFVNNRNVGVPTGVDTPSSAALVGIVMAMALLAIVYIGRRWRILEE